MNNLSKLAVLAGALVLSGATCWYIDRKKTYEERLPLVSSMDPKLFFSASGMIRGAIQPKYILMEFGDFECKPCAAANEDIKSLLKKYPDSLAFTFRNLVDPRHPNSRLAAQIALANPNAQWQIHDALYALDGNLNKEELTKIGKSAGFDPKNSSKQEALLNADEDIAKTVGVNATPSFYLLTMKKDFKVYGPATLDQVDWMIANNID